MEEEDILNLQTCFDYTSWSVFIDSCQCLDELVDTTSSYIRFCEDLFTKTLATVRVGNYQSHLFEMKAELLFYISMVSFFRNLVL